MLYFLLLYGALAHPSWSVRESAECGLRRLVDRSPALYGPRLSELLRGADSEVAARGKRVVAVWDRWRIAQYCPSTCPVWPICDAYPTNVFPAWEFRIIGVPFFLPGRECRDRTKLDPWFHWVPSEAVPLKPPAWTRYRQATERYARHLLVTGSTESEVDALMLHMWEIERAYGSDCSVVLPATGPWTGYIRTSPK